MQAEASPPELARSLADAEATAGAVLRPLRRLLLRDSELAAAVAAERASLATAQPETAEAAASDARVARARQLSASAHAASAEGVIACAVREQTLWLWPSRNGEIGFCHLRPTDTPRPEATTPEIELQLIELTIMVPAAITVFNGDRHEFATSAAGAFCEAKFDCRPPGPPVIHGVQVHRRQWKTAHVAVRAIARICCRGAVAVGRGREPRIDEGGGGHGDDGEATRSPALFACDLWCPETTPMQF